LTHRKPAASGQALIRRLMERLTRRGTLVEHMGQSYPAEPDADGGRGEHTAAVAGGGGHVPHRFGPRAGQVELKLKTLWREGTKHLVMSPLESAQRLAGLLQQPRLQKPTTASQLSV